MSEKIISERIISQKVIGSANPFAKRFRNLSSAITAACMAPILILVGFGVLYYGETFSKDSKVVADLPLSHDTDDKLPSGLIKIDGDPVIIKTVKAPQVGDVLYFSSKQERFAQVEETVQETETVIENGQEIERVVERVKLVDKWEEVESIDGKWGEFKIGNYKVSTSGAKLKLDLKQAEYWSQTDGTYAKLPEGVNRTPQIGDQRITVNFLKGDTTLLIVGEINERNELAASDDLFIISNMTDSELVASLESSENTIYWISKFFAWLFITSGLSGILAPIIALVDFIPFAGSIAKAVAGIASGIIALILVIVASLIIKLWWLFLILTGVIIAALIVWAVMLSNKKAVAKV